ncbi:MAG: AAA family ATPase [Anaerovoracaceae bacterium]
MQEEKKKKISIGVEDFKTLIEKNGYFVDKTLMIRDLIESNVMVTLITRPHRFGKTMNQFMIRRFFEDERTEQGEKIDNGSLFDGLAISRCSEEVQIHQQRYPVIFLSLKSAKQLKYKLAYSCLADEISREFARHRYVLQTENMLEADKRRYENIMERKAGEEEYARGLAFLSECLAKYHGRKAFILIDEYDVPLENAFFHGFYDEMSGFIRSLLESALKTNPYLEKGIITGCLRISRESIFTGLNHMRVYSLLSNQYCDKFGFTPAEVKEMLGYYGISGQYEKLQEWYDGYQFGNAEIYNPWSIFCYLDDALHDDFQPKPYWSNTSSNDIVRKMIEDADDATRRDLEMLMEGGTVEKPVHEDITYGDVHQSQDNLWNFLFFTGYLKAVRKRDAEDGTYLTMSIPNTEVKYIYRQSILSWFNQKMEHTDRSPLIHALEEGNCQEAAQLISDQLMESISYFDYAENYYHGFMTGLLTGTGKYDVESNREKGMGRPDIVLREKKFMGYAMILELKVAGTFRDMEARCDEALKQIEKLQYARPLEEDGYRPVMKYAICFFKKGCIVRKG